MLDLRFIKDNPQAVKANTDNRFAEADIDEVLRLYNMHKALIGEADELRRRRNDIARDGQSPTDNRQELAREGRELKEAIARKEAETEQIKSTLTEAALKVPNMTHPDVPLGRGEKDNVEIRRVGEPPRFDFPVRDHLSIAEDLDLLDFETGAKVSGSKFYYLKNEAVFLELALVRYALDILRERGFTLTITPDIVREDLAAGIGFVPRGDESNIYTLEGTGTCLVGTAEITLGAYHAGDIIDLSGGPLLLAGFSHCFRREAGAAGRYSKGLYRVHQFSKVEMFVYCGAEESDDLLFELLSIEQDIFSGLGLPFRVVDTCTGDLGAPAYRKFDLEAWMPGRGDWGEVTSASNCTDYQARRLGIRYKDGSKSRYAHTLNGTAVAVSRALIALLENGQRADGSVALPESLHPYCGFSEIPKR